MLKEKRVLVILIRLGWSPMWFVPKGVLRIMVPGGNVCFRYSKMELLLYYVFFCSQFS